MPLAGVGIEGAAAAIASLFPVGRAIEPAMFAMTPDGNPAARIGARDAFSRMIDAAEGLAVLLGLLERTGCHARAKPAFAVVLTGETRSYACFPMTKGVVAKAG